MRIHHVQLMIPAGAVDEARAYYSGFLGLEAIPRPASLTREGLWFRCGDQEIHLGVEEPFSPPQTRAHAAFVVADLQSLRDRIEGADLEVRDAAPIQGRRRFHTWDPFGNRLEFMEDGPRG